MSPKSKRERYAELGLGEEPGLAVANFQPATEAVVMDPLIETQIMVTLDQLKPYDRNPRKSRNPKYDEIKESIRSRGLDNKPNITRRPGESQYMIVSGGNTRLAILNELWGETQDEDFYRLTCLFVPWRGEIYAMTGHLIENDARGEMTFIDRAIAVQELHGLFAEEGGDKLSLRTLAARLTQEGYAASPGHLSKMFYALEHLYPAIPETFKQGLGKHQVERLIRLRNACQKAFALFESNREIFELAFAGGLAEFDLGTEAWDVQRVQDGILAHLAGILAQPINRFALEVDAAMTGRLDVTEEADAPGNPSLLWDGQAESPNEPERLPPSDAPSDTSPAVSRAAQSPRNRQQQPDGQGSAALAEPERTADTLPSRLTDLRRHNYAQARAIATAAGFPTLVLVSEQMNGFLVDVPADDSAFDLPDERAQSIRQYWWLLFGLSEMLVSTHGGEAFLPWFDDRLIHFNRLLEQTPDRRGIAELVLGRCGLQRLPAVLLVTTPQLFSLVHVSIFQQLMALFDGVRRCQELRVSDPDDALFSQLQH